MISHPHTLKRDSTGSATCCKCAALLRDELKANHSAAPKTRLHDAHYTLTQALQSWRLCTNHAAAASWALGIKSAFNPEGKTTLKGKPE